MVSYQWVPQQSVIDSHRSDMHATLPSLPGAFGISDRSKSPHWIDYDAFADAFPHVAAAVADDSRMNGISPVMIDLYQQGFSVDTWNGEYADVDEHPWLFICFMNDGSFMGFSIPPKGEYDPIYYRGYEA